MSSQALQIGSLLYVLLVLGAASAYLDKFLTITQMRSKGFSQGLPWIMHGGMVGDIILVTPLCITTVDRYAGQWSLMQWSSIGATCLFVSFALHAWYDKGALESKVPESHTYFGQRTLAGWFHLYYMALALTIVALLFICTEHADRGFLIWSTVILVTHMFFGTHCHLKIIRPSWYQVSFKIADALTLIVIGLVLVGLTFNATR